MVVARRVAVRFVEREGGRFAHARREGGGTPYPLKAQNEKRRNAAAPGRNRPSCRACSPARNGRPLGASGKPTVIPACQDHSVKNQPLGVAVVHLAYRKLQLIDGTFHKFWINAFLRQLDRGRLTNPGWKKWIMPRLYGILIQRSTSEGSALPSLYWMIQSRRPYWRTLAVSKGPIRS